MSWFKLHADFFADEFKRIALLIIEAVCNNSCLGHFVKKAFHPLVCHDAYARYFSVARVNNATLAHFINRISQLRIRYFRIVLFNGEISGVILSIEIMIPADNGGIDKTLYEIRIAGLSLRAYQLSLNMNHSHNQRAEKY